VIDNKYDPPQLEVPAGTTVRWTNRGAEDHDVGSMDLKTILSPTLKPGASFETTLTQPGTIPYFCSFHDDMAGTIVVR
jgi:plastocyanin